MCDQCQFKLHKDNKLLNKYTFIDIYHKNNTKCSSNLKENKCFLILNQTWMSLYMNAGT